jgi:nucleoid-associated protein YgaU
VGHAGSANCDAHRFRFQFWRRQSPISYDAAEAAGKTGHSFDSPHAVAGLRRLVGSCLALREQDDTRSEKRSSALVRLSRLLGVASVLGVGFCAALPFYQPRQRLPEPRPAIAPLELTLRRPDSPLRLASPTESSPAIGLARVPAGAASAPGDIHSTSAGSIDLAHLVPPPALPVSFQPTPDSSPTNDWKPRTFPGESLVNRPALKPRPYRLRDGDTLEKVAERFLGNPARAAEIFEANHGVLSRPDLLPVGVTIVIPARELPQ